MDMATLKTFRTKYLKDKIFLFPCNKCRKGIQALHVQTCVLDDCDSVNHFYDPDLKVDSHKWEQCLQDIRLWESGKLNQSDLNENVPIKDETPTRDTNSSSPLKPPSASVLAKPVTQVSNVQESLRLQELIEDDEPTRDSAAA